MGDYASGNEAFLEAAAAYVERGDRLGQANVERALATNALLLGRHEQGARRLDRAAELYRALESADGLVGSARPDVCLEVEAHGGPRMAWGLTLVALAVGKLFFYDLSQQPATVLAIGFLVVGIALLTIGTLYAKSLSSYRQRSAPLPPSPPVGGPHR